MDNPYMELAELIGRLLAVEWLAEEERRVQQTERSSRPEAAPELDSGKRAPDGSEKEPSPAAGRPNKSKVL